MLSVELVFDRSTADVFEAEEMMKLPWWEFTEEQQLAFLNGLRGCYDFTDLNRVETAVAEISSRMVELPSMLDEIAAAAGVSWDKLSLSYDPQEAVLATKNFWEATELFEEAERERYLSNIKYIRDSLTPELPMPSDFDTFDWQVANNLEKILFEADAALTAFEKKILSEIEEEATGFNIKSGESYSGEVRV